MFRKNYKNLKVKIKSIRKKNLHLRMIYVIGLKMKALLNKKIVKSIVQLIKKSLHSPQLKERKTKRIKKAKEREVNIQITLLNLVLTIKSSTETQSTMFLVCLQKQGITQLLLQLH